MKQKPRMTDSIKYAVTVHLRKLKAFHVRDKAGLFWDQLFGNLMERLRKITMRLLISGYAGSYHPFLKMTSLQVFCHLVILVQAQMYQKQFLCA